MIKNEDHIKRAKKVIIDCDPGVDDSIAIILALHLAQKHNIEILGVTCADGNAPLDQVCHNAALLLNICGKEDIPVYKGHPRISHDFALFFHGIDAFGGHYQEYVNQIGEGFKKQIQQKPAVDFLIETCKKYEKEVTIIALAPLTNLAECVKVNSGFASTVKDIVMLGGTYLTQGNTQLCCSEFNIFKDPESADKVFKSFENIVMVPIEITHDSRKFDQTILSEAFNQKTKKGELVRKLYEPPFSYLQCYDICDQLAVAAAMEPETILEYMHKQVVVETKGDFTKGMTMVDWFDRLSLEYRVKIVTKMDYKLLCKILKDSVLE